MKTEVKKNSTKQEKETLKFDKAIINRVSKLSNEQLMDMLFALEMSADMYIQTFFSMAEEDSYERIHKMIMDAIKGKDKVSIQDLVAIPPQKYCVDLLPIASIVAHIQFYEEELDKRGVYQEYCENMYFYVRNSKGEETESNYPTYVVRMFDLILGYVSGVYDDLFSIRSLIGTAREIIAANDYDMDNPDIFFRNVAVKDEDEDMNHPVNQHGLMS